VKNDTLNKYVFARCPRCNSVIRFEVDASETKCLKCGVKVKKK
jgi:PHP family Zn ribbon phosphoesterase